jgi:molybdopterin-containing oxidoreductase family iron-sulfur binding subunit
VFGDLRDKSAHVTELQRNPRAYDVLGELDTRPRTRFLAKLRNRPTVAGGASEAGHEEKHTQASSQQSEVLG